MVRFPAWLPGPIAVHAEQLFSSGTFAQDHEARCRLIRLSCDAGMQKVWNTLSRAAPDQTALVEFLDQVRLHPTVLGPRVPPSALSAAQQRATIRRIAKLANTLLEQLQHLGGNASGPESGLALLERALLRAEMEALRLRASGAVFPLLSVPGIAQGDEVQPSPIEVLTALARSAELAAAAPPPPGPRKQKARNASRTAYVQDISAFVQHRFGQPLPSVVAATVSVALNDVELNEDLVRKLTRPQRNIPGNKSK